MIDISTIKIGDKVHYIPFEGCDESLIENGIVKEIPEHTFDSVRVVTNVIVIGKGLWVMRFINIERIILI